MTSTRLRVVTGDITSLEVDAVVNAANEAMLGGGGVDGAIHRAAGPELLEACRAVPEIRSGIRCPTGEARITPGFRLRARHVIHTVGPVWRGGRYGEPEFLAACYRESLELAARHDLRSIAFPAISTGAYRFPPVLAARVAAGQCVEFLERHAGFGEILLVAFREADAAILRSGIHSVTPTGGPS